MFQHTTSPQCMSYMSGFKAQKISKEPLIKNNCKIKRAICKYVSIVLTQYVPFVNTNRIVQHQPKIKII